MVRLIDRYLLREMVVPAILALLVATIVLELHPFATLGETLIEKGVPWQTTARLFSLLALGSFTLAVPIALLIGLLVAGSRLSADSEWVAFQACGVNVSRLLRPALMLGTVACLVTGSLYQSVLPRSRLLFRELLYSIASSVTESEVKPQVFFEALPDRVLFVRDRGRGGWNGVFVADTAGQDPARIYLARHGRLVVDRTRRDAFLALTDVTVHTVDDPPQDEYRCDSAALVTIPIDWQVIAPSIVVNASTADMTMAELREQIDGATGQRALTVALLLELHQRYAAPAACVLVALVGIGFGLTTRRGGKLGAFVLGLAVIFGYYEVMFGARALAFAGLMRPALAAWLPDTLLFAVGVLAITQRGRTGSRTDALRSQAAAALAWVTGAAGAWWGAHARHFTVQRRILDWYYLRIYGAFFLVTLGALLGVYYLSMLTELSQDLISGGATLTMMARFLWFSTPQTLDLAIPISALIATLVTIGLLTRRTELVVARACGISLYRAVLPFVAVSVLWSVALFGLEEYVLPRCDRQAAALWSQMHGKRVVDGAAERHWMASRSGAIYHYERFDPALDELRNLTVFELDADNRLRRRTFVARALYAGSADDHNASWAVADGRTWDFDRDGVVRATRPFADGHLTLESPAYFRLDRAGADQMTYGELRRYVSDLRARGVDATGDLVALERKLSFPLIVVILTLLAIPFGTMAGGRGALYGIGLGICLAFACWISFNVFGGLGKAEVLAPWMAAWAPTTLWGGFAMCLLLTVRT